MRGVSGAVTLLFKIAVLVGLPSCLGAETPAERRDLLAAHNRLRAAVGVPPLEWSKQLASVAQQWAKQLAAAGKLAHRAKGQYGENLFAISGARANPSDVVAEWASEAKDYNAAKNTCRRGAVCGHYTQIVWRETKKVGCGVAQSGRRQVWVCNYDPPGNWIGQRPY
jgi:uncharacterized protein YkwD